jgi:hypothetical protein
VPRLAVLVASALAATVVIVVGGVLALDDGDDTTPPEPDDPFTTTPLSDVDTTGVSVVRGPFCEAIDDQQVEAVLGAVPDVLEWRNGDELDLAGGRRDVVHEFGCSYAVQGVGSARAWVFAPPVDEARATRLVKSAQQGAGCETGTGPAFGSPTVALTCTDKQGTTRASYRGLFGDAWLVCEVEQPAGGPADPLDVAGRWCVGVLEAARGTP